MNTETIKQIFTMLSGEPADGLSPLFQISAYQVGKMLRADADQTDIRVNYLCAAMANYRFQQMKASRDRTEVTYAGKMLDGGRNRALEYAERLLRDYIQLSEDILQTTTFVFMSIPGEEA